MSFFWFLMVLGLLDRRDGPAIRPYGPASLRRKPIVTEGMVCTDSKQQVSNLMLKSQLKTLKLHATNSNTVLHLFWTKAPLTKGCKQQGLNSTGLTLANVTCRTFVAQILGRALAIVTVFWTFAECKCWLFSTRL